jgi:hypothetical protein
VFKFWRGQADIGKYDNAFARGARRMKTLVVLSIGINLALGCLALVYGVLMNRPEAVKTQSLSPVQDE